MVLNFVIFKSEPAHPISSTRCFFKKCIDLIGFDFPENLIIMIVLLNWIRLSSFEKFVHYDSSTTSNIAEDRAAKLSWHPSLQTFSPPGSSNLNNPGLFIRHSDIPWRGGLEKLAFYVYIVMPGSNHTIAMAGRLNSSSSALLLYCFLVFKPLLLYAGQNVQLYLVPSYALYSKTIPLAYSKTISFLSFYFYIHSMESLSAINLYGLLMTLMFFVWSYNDFQAFIENFFNN